MGDYLRKIIVHGKSSATTSVDEIMTEKSMLITVKPDADVYSCMQLMTDRKIRHLPVISDDKQLLGLVSIRDLLDVLVEDQRKQHRHLQDYIRGGYSG
eukprot:SM000060S19654  [mRNA]  locus=s60:365310:366485:- [translate_table: standard]